MILDLHGEALDRWVEARTFGNGPALHHSIELEPEIEMEMTGRVLLNHEAQSTYTSGGGLLFSRRLASTREVALFSVLGELRARAWRRGSGRLNSHELL